MPISGDSRTLHDPEVAISATTNAMSAIPTAATKYSLAGRPFRRLRFTTASYTDAGRGWRGGTGGSQVRTFTGSEAGNAVA